MHVSVTKKWERLFVQVKPTRRGDALSWHDDKLERFLSPALDELGKLEGAAITELDATDPSTIIITAA